MKHPENTGEQLSFFTEIEINPDMDIEGEQLLFLDETEISPDLNIIAEHTSKRLTLIANELGLEPTRREGIVYSFLHKPNNNKVSIVEYTATAIEMINHDFITVGQLEAFYEKQSSLMLKKSLLLLEEVQSADLDEDDFRATWTVTDTIANILREQGQNIFVDKYYSGDDRK